MPTIDNKIVQMTFDNQQFERGVAESLKSLEALKKGLELDKAVDSLSNLEKTANSFDISGIAKGVEQVADKFTFLGKIAQNVYDDIYRAGKQAIGGVINMITAMPNAGEQKYETKNKAVQMIKAALPEKSLEDVEAVLARLNEYTDLTSYDFATMAKSIGKFTAAGIDLDVAERAMEGIANQTASAGGEISTANIAMYNFSQALSAGAVKMMDWKSIENQNLATKEFKEQIIQTAIELGKLGKVQEGVGKTAKGTKVSYLSFRETLREGWFDNDVLIGVLEKYADRESEVGERAFKAAREAITLQQAVDAVKDAMSTGWMHSWQLLIGNLDEATDFLTKTSDAIIDFFDIFSSFRNEVLEGWHYGFEGYLDDASGYVMATEMIGQAFEIVAEYASQAATSIGQVFGFLDENGENTYSLSRMLLDVTKSMHDSVGSVWSEMFDSNGDGIKDVTDSVEESAESAAKAVRAWSGDLAKGVKGSKDEVKTMQELFMRLSSDTDTFGDKFKDVVLTNFGADGIFGKETEAAVKAFQQAMDIDVTGVFDSKTRELLDGLIPPIVDSKPLATWNEELKKGAKSDEVKNMQSLFLELNQDTERFGDKFKDVVLTNFGADGIFGKETEAAVKAFQAEMGLPVTGIFDTQTQEALHRVLYPEDKGEKTVFERTEEAVYRIAPGLKKFKSIVTAIFSVIKLGTSVVKVAVGVVTSVAKAIAPVAYGVFSLIAGISDIATLVLDFVSAFNLADVALGLFNGVLTPVSNALSEFGGFLTLVGDGLSAISAMLRSGAGLDEIGEELMKNPVENKGALMIYNFFVGLREAAANLAPYINQIKDSIGAFFVTAYQFVSSKIGIAIEAIGNFFTDMWNKMKEGQVAEKVLGVLVVVLKGLLGIVSAVGAGVYFLGKAIFDGLKWVWNYVAGSELLAKAFEAIKSVAQPVGAFFSSLFETLSGVGKDLKKYDSFEKIWEQFIYTISKSKIGVKFVRPLLKIKSRIQGLVKSISGFKDSVFGIFTNLKEGLSLDEILKNLMEDPEKNKASINLVNFLMKLKDIFYSVKGMATNFGISASGAFKGIWGAVKNFGSNLWNSIVNFFTQDGERSFIDGIGQELEGIWNTIVGAWNNVVGWFTEFVTTNETVITVTGWAQSAWAGIVEYFTAGSDGKGLVENIQESFERIKVKIRLKIGHIKRDWAEFIEKNPAIAKVVGWAESAWANIVEYFTAGSDGKGLVENIQESFEKIKVKIRLKIGHIKRDWAEFIEKNPVITKVVGWAESAWANIVEYFTAGSDGKGLVENIQESFERIKVKIRLKIGHIKRDWAEFIEKNPVITKVVGWAESAWANIVGFFIPTEEDTDPVAYIRNRIDKIWKDIELIWSDIAKWWAELREKYPIVDALSSGAETIWDGIKKFFTPKEDETFFEHIINEFETMWGEVGKVFDAFGTKMTEFVNQIPIVGTLINTGKTVWDAIRNFFAPEDGQSFFDNLATEISNINVEEAVKKARNILLQGMGIILLKEIIKGLGGISGIVGNIAKKLNWDSDIGSKKDSFGKKMRDFGLGILAIGASIWIVVDAIKRMKELLDEVTTVWDGVKLGLALAAIAGFLIAVGQIQQQSTQINFGSGIQLGGAISAAIAVRILVEAIGKLCSIINANDKNFKSNNWWELSTVGKALAAIAGLFVEVGALDIAASRWGKDGRKLSVGGPLAIAYAVEILVGAISEMAKLVDTFGAVDAIYDEEGNFVKWEDAYTTLGKAISIISGLFTLFAGSDILKSIIDAKNASKVTFAGAAGTAISSASGILGLAYSIKLIVDSLSEALVQIQKAKVSDTLLTEFSVAIGAISTLMEAFTIGAGFMTSANPLAALGMIAQGGGILLAITGVTDLISALADAMVTVKDVSPKNMDSFGNLLRSVYGLINGISLGSGLALGGILEALGSAGAETATQAFTHFTDALLLSGNDIASFERATRDISDWGVLETAATKLSSMVNIISSITQADNAATVLETIGGALALYGMNVAGITIDENGNIDTKMLEDVFAALAGVFESDNAVAAIAAIAPGDGSAVTDFSVGVVNLATALESYSKNIGGLDPDKVATANDLLKTVAGLDLPTEGTWWGFLTGKQTLSQFAGNLTNIGEGVAGFSRALEGFHPEDGVVTAALDVIGTLVGYATSLDSLGSQYMNFDTLRESFTGFFSGLENYLADPYGGNYDSASLLAYSEAAVALLTAIATGLSQNIGILETAVGTVLTTMYTDFNAKQDWWYKIGMNIDYGMAEGIYKGSADPVIAALAVSKAIWSVVSAFFGIASPSKEFAWVGQMVDAGLAQGLTQYSNVVESASEDVAQATLNGYDTGILNSISDTPVIRPVLDLSDVTSGVATMGGMFGNYNVGVTSSGIATRIASEGTLSIGGSGAQDLVGAVSDLNDRVDQLTFAISNMKVVTETGAIIGAISTGIDIQLGENEFYDSRGI